MSNAYMSDRETGANMYVNTTNNNHEDVDYMIDSVKRRLEENCPPELKPIKDELETKGFIDNAYNYFFNKNKKNLLTQGLKLRQHYRNNPAEIQKLLSKYKTDESEDNFKEIHKYINNVTNNNNDIYSAKALFLAMYSNIDYLAGIKMQYLDDIALSDEYFFKLIFDSYNLAIELEDNADLTQARIDINPVMHDVFKDMSIATEQQKNTVQSITKEKTQEICELIKTKQQNIDKLEKEIVRINNLLLDQSNSLTYYTQEGDSLSEKSEEQKNNETVSIISEQVIEGMKIDKKVEQIYGNSNYQINELYIKEYELMQIRMDIKLKAFNIAGLNIEDIYLHDVNKDNINTLSTEKIFARANEVVEYMNMLPAKNNNRMIFSEEKIITSFFILEKAINESQKITNKNGGIHNLSRHTHYKESYKKIIKMLIVHPKYDLVSGFEVLPEAEQKILINKLQKCNEQKKPEIINEIGKKVEDKKTEITKEIMNKLINGSEIAPEGKTNTTTIQRLIKSNKEVKSILEKQIKLLVDIELAIYRVRDYNDIKYDSHNIYIQEQLQKLIEEYDSQITQTNQMLMDITGAFEVHGDKVGYIEQFKNILHHHSLKAAIATGFAISGGAAGYASGTILYHISNLSKNTLLTAISPTIPTASGLAATAAGVQVGLTAANLHLAGSDLITNKKLPTYYRNKIQDINKNMQNNTINDILHSVPPAIDINKKNANKHILNTVNKNPTIKFLMFAFLATTLFFYLTPAISAIATAISLAASISFTAALVVSYSLIATASIATSLLSLIGAKKLIEKTLKTENEIKDQLHEAQAKIHKIKKDMSNNKYTKENKDIIKHIVEYIENEITESFAEAAKQKDQKELVQIKQHSKHLLEMIDTISAGNFNSEKINSLCKKMIKYQQNKSVKKIEQLKKIEQDNFIENFKSENNTNETQERINKTLEKIKNKIKKNEKNEKKSTKAKRMQLHKKENIITSFNKKTIQDPANKETNKVPSNKEVNEDPLKGMKQLEEIFNLTKNNNNTHYKK
jgi:hypothetical protein